MCAAMAGTMTATTPAMRLIEALALGIRTAAEVQDLYSRPIAAGPIELRPRPTAQPTPALAA
ncbi:MAG TPA: hypothetical protein VFZ26_08420 [Gemmatimonadales bacterium]